jgi:preprotein translocase subunit YajC
MWISILAQATQPAGPPPPQWLQILGGPFLPLMLGLLLLWVVMIRGKQKTEKTRQSMLKELKKNDRVETIGGVLGTIVEVRDGEVVVKVDETTNTKMRFRRSAIHRVVVEEEKK